MGTDKGGGLGAVAAAELGQDVAHMSIYGALGDEEPLGDLPVRQALGDQPCNLVFAPDERKFLLLSRRRSGDGGEPNGGGDTVSSAHCPAGFTQRDSGMADTW
jgi:hypothetical protein